MSRRSLLIAPLLVLLVGCDQLGIESASASAARHEAEGRAVGAACRHAARAIEDCFALNRRTDKAAIYAGWREMDDYMRENKIDAVAPALQPRTAKKADADTADDVAPKSAQADAPAGGEKADRVAARDAGADKADKPSAAH